MHRWYNDDSVSPAAILPRTIYSLLFSSSQRCLSRSSNSLRLHRLGLAHNLVRCTLNDPTCFGQLGGHAHEVSVDVAGGLAAFVDAPVMKKKRIVVSDVRLDMIVCL